MLEPVMCSREHRAPFVPDDLLMVQETDAQQAILNRLNEILNRRSYIRNLVAGVQSELAGA